MITKFLSENPWIKATGGPRRTREDMNMMKLAEVGIIRMDWIHLNKDMDQWRAFENAILNIRVPYKP